MGHDAGKVSGPDGDGTGQAVVGGDGGACHGAPEHGNRAGQSAQVGNPATRKF